MSLEDGEVIKVASRFNTREIGLVAYMDMNNTYPCELKIVKTNSNGKKIAEFVFDKSDSALKMKEDYFQSKASIEPIRFMDSIRKVKTRINNLDV